MESRDFWGKILSGSFILMFVPQFIIALIIFAFGIFSLVINIGININKRTYIPATANIVDIKNDGDGWYTPIYEYECVGEVVKIDGFSTTDRSSIRVGDEVNINYNPKNCKQFNINYSDNELFEWITIIIALFCSCSGIYMFIKLIKKFKAYNFNGLDMLDDMQNNG